MCIRDRYMGNTLITQIQHTHIYVLLVDRRIEKCPIFASLAGSSPSCSSFCSGTTSFNSRCTLSSLCRDSSKENRFLISADRQMRDVSTESVPSLRAIPWRTLPAPRRLNTPRVSKGGDHRLELIHTNTHKQISFHVHIDIASTSSGHDLILLICDLLLSNIPYLSQSAYFLSVRIRFSVKKDDHLSFFGLCLHHHLI
eukprot:TRINITY_DN3859_c0_g2_i2.p1 TRINITY_DN3859_c0_g2~~TRINITY_DN3859_c0_g2_i2.p1  ORF type:complete len:225 (-),score=14.43 TRINITY_DN3859_c0_g2_i2:140-733(-)